MANPTFPLLNFPNELIIAVGRAVPADRPADLRNLMLGNHFLYELLEPVLLDAAMTYPIPQGIYGDRFYTVPGWIIFYAESIPMLRKLLSRGLPLDTPFSLTKNENGELIGFPSKSGCPLFYKALAYNNAKAVKAFIDLGGDLLKAFSQENPWLAPGTPACSTFFDTEEIPRMLIQGGLNVDQKWDGKTALHYLTEERHSWDKALPSIRVLLEHGADVDAKDKEGRSPLKCFLDTWFDTMYPINPTFRVRNTYRRPVALKIARLLLKHSKELESVGNLYIDKALGISDYHFGRLIRDAMKAKNLVAYRYRYSGW